VVGEGTDDTVYFLVFAEEDGRWLVGTVVDADDEGGMAPPAAGTPAAADQRRSSVPKIVENGHG